MKNFLTACRPTFKRQPGEAPLIVLCDHDSCYVLRERVAG